MFLLPPLPGTQGPPFAGNFLVYFCHNFCRSHTIFYSWLQLITSAPIPPAFFWDFLVLFFFWIFLFYSFFGFSCFFSNIFCRCPTIFYSWLQLITSAPLPSVFYLIFLFYSFFGFSCFILSLDFHVSSATTSVGVTPSSTPG